MNSGRKLGMVLLGAMVGTAAAMSFARAAEPPLKVGLLEDVSGDLAFMGMPKLSARSWPSRRSTRAAVSWGDRSS
ncbi:hypothetical protein AB7M69_008044 [Bradyrhizobium japonicum]